MTQADDSRRASLEYLKKLAKKRLSELKAAKPDAKLADAQLLVARDAGFSSWRKLKAEFDQRDEIEASPFFHWCTEGNVAELRKLLDLDARLANAVDPASSRPGWSALHTAVYANQLGAVTLLISYGADVNVREGWGNAAPLHFAANNGHAEIVKALLDAGADLHANDDAHHLGVIGWATQFNPHRTPDDSTAVLELLLKRGATHHIYSAIATGEIDIVRRVLESNPAALQLRAIDADMTPLSWAIRNRRYDMMELLIQCGADIEEPNSNGRTVLAEAVLDGNADVVNRLRKAGACEARLVTAEEMLTRHPGLASSVYKVVPMLSVPDIAETLDWYKAIGFTEVGRYWEHGELKWATMLLGAARVTLSLGRNQPARDLKLWFYTQRIDDVYEVIKARQVEVAHDVLAGRLDRSALIRFIREINDPPYGSREFGVRDLNGYALYFIRPPTEDRTGPSMAGG